MNFITSCCGRPIEECPGCPGPMILRPSEKMSDLDTLSFAELLDIGLLCDVPTTIDLLASSSIKRAREIRPLLSAVITSSPVYAYWNPATEEAGFTHGTADDRLLCKEAIEQLNLSFAADLDLRDDWWVKVAASPTIQTLGEVLQFLPSKWMPGVGGRPAASMVASALLGGGLGYGGGLLAERFIPEKYREPGLFARNMAIAGGLTGAGIGAIPGVANLMAGRSFNDPSVLTYGKEPQAADNLGIMYSSACRQAAAEMFSGVDTELVKEAMGTLSQSDSPLIRTDELGRVVWGGQSTASTTLLTTAAMYGASQMPDPRALPGTVTPHQTGLLSMAMGAAGGGLQGYLTGYGAGKTLALLTGLPPEAQHAVTMTGLGLGIANAVIPRILGLSQ